MLKRGRWAIGAVSMLLGIMLVSQYRMTQTLADSNVRLQRAGDLALQLTEAQKERDDLRHQLDLIKKGDVSDGLAADYKLLKQRAGLTTVTGPGITVTISDSKVPVKDNENPNLYLIHDEDILRIVNELRAGGAEAIAINDQRLIGTSEVRCAGPTIMVNGKVFGPPFTIKAIGKPETLAAALTMRGGVVDTLKYWGIDLNIQQLNSVTVPAFNGTFREEYIKSSTSQGGTTK
ncbi:MAG: DUF881 domain-containing protein [Veillonella sp.]|jgi:uncharacterized protein YlxW (UPF0749 family)|nr:DUF881 domain-containing protein [Veillonella sp.]MBP9625530.1 DUF881 domain-containing protein [Veillonella sp.]